MHLSWACIFAVALLVSAELPRYDEIQRGILLTISDVEYRIEKFLGQGASGNVYSAISSSNHEQVAIKVVNIEEEYSSSSTESFKTPPYLRGSISDKGSEKDSSSTATSASVFTTLNDLDYIENEIAIMKALQGEENIVQYIDSAISDSTAFIVMELCHGGTLDDFVGPLKEEKDLINVISGLETALNALSKHGILHRDIKPENVFLTSDGTVKLADFGCAAFWNEDSTSTAGSMDYMAPERLLGKEYQEGSDIWSAGVTILEAMTKVSPLQFFTDPAERLACTAEQYAARIEKYFEEHQGELEFSEEYPSRAVVAVQQMLQLDSSRRSTVPT